jgi:hypothetical protein
MHLFFLFLSGALTCLSFSLYAMQPVASSMRAIFIHLKMKASSFSSLLLPFAFATTEKVRREKKNYLKLTEKEKNDSNKKKQQCCCCCRFC